MKPRAVQKVGIVGAGLMATQLATLFLRRLEVPVVLRDIEQERVDEALATIREEVGARKPFLATIVDGEPAGSSSRAATSCSRRSSRS